MISLEFSPEAELQKSEQRLAEYLKLEQDYQTAVREKYALVKKAIDALVPVLSKAGLEIRELRYRIDLKDAFSQPGQSPSHRLHFSMQLRSIGKFKFIQFAGYKPSGEGRNQDRLRLKAAQLDELMNSAQEEMKFFTNLFSLEVKDNREVEPFVIVEGALKKDLR